MTILLKRFQLTADGLHPDGETLFEGNSLTLGASSDRNIIVEWPGVQLRHAEVALTDDNQLHVSSHAKNGFTFKRGLFARNKATHDATLKSGQSFKIGNHEFGFSVEDDQPIISITVDETAAPPTTPRFNTRLIHTGISKRRWSEVLLAIIVYIFVVSPIVNRTIQNDEDASDLGEYLPSDVKDLLPAKIKSIRPADYGHLFPSDSSWNTGEFHPAHQFFANDCSTCHNEAFTPVTKETCVSCHSAVSYHFPPNSLDIVEDSRESNCQSCHKEHNGEDKLVTDNQNLCIDCHQQITEYTNGSSTLRKVKDWQISHPEITLKMAHWDDDSQNWMYQQNDARNPPAEQSGIKFPHDLHLHEAGFPDSDGENRVLACADCHTANAGGELMEPIQMETHCESCHELEIEANNVYRSVRHGDIDSVLIEIAGLKGLSALLPKPTSAANTKQADPAPATLKLPGKLDKSSKRAKQAQTLSRVASDLIEKRSCVTCHTINTNSEAIADNQLSEAWEIQPVRIIERWIDEAEFDHGRHLTMNCNACHTQIGVSSSAEDVNIPSRGLCQDCHGNPDESHLSPSQCVDCHSYHIPDHGWIGATPSSFDSSSPVILP